jgi:drug/metabolite transporter (DMT)-like permease
VPERPAVALGLPAAAAGGAVAVWSTNALAAGEALQELSVLQVLALQFAAATAVVLAARCWGCGAGGSSRLPTSRAAAVGVVGLAGTIALQYVAFATATLVAANAIAYAWPLLVAAWAALIPGGRGSRASLGLALVGFAGVIMIFAQRGSGGADGEAPLLGYAAALGSALTMAWYTLAVGRTAGSRTDLLLVATGAGAVVTIPLALLEGGSWSAPLALALALYTGLGPMAAGYALWTLAMSHPAGPRLAPIAYATPLLSTAVLLASGQRLSTVGLLGCALIVICAAGVLATMGDGVGHRRPGVARDAGRW